MTNLRTNDKGLVSITVTVILMLVISITVMSFAQIIRREQRQALDAQLSSQAFYAAESGINAAREYLKSIPIDEVPTKDSCSWTGYPELAAKRNLDGSGGTSFTCVLIGGTPKSLVYELSTTAPAKVFPVDADTNIIREVEFSWTPSTDSAPLSGCTTSVATNLPTPASWPCNGYGMLRVDLVPYGVSSGQNRAGMLANTFTAFFSPTTTGSPTAISYQGAGTNIYGGVANQGARTAVRCTVDECKMTVTNLSTTRYYARVMPIYRDTTLTIVARGDGGVELPLKGAQIMVDATGRAQDVLRRIQVRVPLTDDSLHSDFGIQTTDSLCKRFTAYPGYSNATSCP